MEFIFCVKVKPNSQQRLEIRSFDKFYIEDGTHRKDTNTSKFQSSVLPCSVTCSYVTAVLILRREISMVVQSQVYLDLN